MRSMENQNNIYFMRLDKFKEFKSINESKNEIDSLCKKYGIENYTINDDLTLDVNGNVHLYDKELTKLPIKFRKVSGYFDCSSNQLTSLEGSPQEVGGYFYCSYNQLTSLEGCPKEVGGSFFCYNNQLTSLEGSPRKVGGNFYCYNNQLKDVNGFPEKFYGDKLFIHNNPVNEVFKIFPMEKWTELPELLNEFEVIDSKRGRVYSMGLKLCFEDLGLEVPQNLGEIKLKNYEIR